MKVVKLSFLVVLAATVALGVSTTAYSFHSGGVAECEGCHSMHAPKAGGSNLLVGTDASSACLTCHDGPTLSSYHVSTSDSVLGPGLNPVNRTPGGDFSWLKKSYAGGSGSSAFNEPGRTHGHNIVAADFGFVPDDNNLTSPGGSFTASNLSCVSCHDPHGKYRRDTNGVISRTGLPIKASGSYADNGATNEPTATAAVGVYRILAGSGYTLARGTFPIAFPGVPAAKAPSTYNRTESGTDTRVAYGVATTSGHTTWANWCGTCHGAMHSTGSYTHPVDQGLGSTIAGLYNQYVKSGDMSGTSATSFSSLNPFTTNSNNYMTLAGLVTSTAGPGSSDQVNCLSCHRAHASGFLHALRFDQGYEFMTKGGQYIGSDNPEITGSRAPLQHRGRTIADWTAAYYDRPATDFATYQRVLCNKCHAKD